MQCMLYSSPMFSPNNLCEIRSKLVARESLIKGADDIPSQSHKMPEAALQARSAKRATENSMQLRSVWLNITSYGFLGNLGRRTGPSITSFLANKQTNTARIEEFSEKGDPPRRIQFLWNS